METWGALPRGHSPPPALHNSLSSCPLLHPAFCTDYHWLGHHQVSITEVREKYIFFPPCEQFPSGSCFDQCRESNFCLMGRGQWTPHNPFSAATAKMTGQARESWWFIRGRRVRRSGSGEQRGIFMTRLHDQSRLCPYLSVGDALCGNNLLPST